MNDWEGIFEQCCAVILLGRYYYELARGVEKTQAIRFMLIETGLGVLISGIAISAAMSTFLLSEIPAVRSLGLQTSLGVLSTLFSSVLLLPSILVLLPTPKKLMDPENPGIIGNFLRALSKNVSRARYVMMGIALVIVAISVFGALKIEVNSNVMDFFAENSTIRKSTDVVEDNFGGASQVKVRVTSDLSDPEVLRQMLSFQEQARDIDGIGQSTSIASILREINEVLAGEATMPASQEAVAQELLLWQISADDPSDITELITLDNTQALMTVTAKLMSSQQTRGVIEEFQLLAGNTFSNDVELDYIGQLIDNIASEDALLRDFIVSLTLAIILVIIIDSFVRSLRAALVTILALLITIALQYGFLGYLGVNLDMATMLLGALAIGVGDYAIHLTVRYMEERRKGLAPEAAMDESIFSSGRAIFFTALTLGGGFLPLVFGSVLPVQRLGSFMVVTVVAVGIASLTLLPAACLIFLRNPQRRPESRKFESKEFV